MGLEGATIILRSMYMPERYVEAKQPEEHGIPHHSSLLVLGS